MSDSLTLTDIGKRTGVPLVRLRYIADSEILPGNRIQTEAAPRRPGRGVTRTFTPCEAFGMVIAVQLLDAGIRRESVSKIMDILSARPAGARNRNEVPLIQAFSCVEVESLEIGDGVNIHLFRDPPQIFDPIFRHWIQINTGAKVSDYKPLVSIRINVEKLRLLVR
jgi:hypothetical protein